MDSLGSPIVSSNGATHVATNSPQSATFPNSIPRSPATRPALIPVVDLSSLRDQRSRHGAVTELGTAAVDWGFVQVINHGVPQRSVDGIWTASQQFFSLPPAEREPFLAKQSPSHPQWKETVQIRGVLGPEDLVPPNCREAIVEFSKEMRTLAEQLFDALLEFLGVPVNLESNAEFISTSGLSIHSYPPCPEGAGTLGLMEHTDLATMSFLLQDQVSGFELLKGDEWLSFKPIEGAFTFVVGEQLEILSNGKFKSVMHRVLANQKKMRMSVGTFYAPRAETKVAAFPQLVRDEESPYKNARRFGDHPALAFLDLTKWFV